MATIDHFMLTVDAPMDYACVEAVSRDPERVECAVR
jgi:hypothetical protein